MYYQKFTQFDLQLLPREQHEEKEENFKWEERARLLMEISFLSRMWQGEEGIILYLGNDKTVKTLSRFFPCFRFHVYTSGSSILPLIFHKEEFNEEIAQGWRNTARITSVYLISYLEMEKQERYYSVISPKAALLEFNLQEDINYLDGYVLKKPWSNSLSLLPRNSQKIYGKSYILAHNYHEKIVRKKHLYYNVLTDKKLPITEKLNNTYDASCEVFILRDYLTKLNKKVHAQNIIYLSSLITSCLNDDNKEKRNLP